MNSHPGRPAIAADPRAAARRLTAVGLAAAAMTAGLQALPGAAPARADAPRPDHVTISVAGSPAYRLEGDALSGGIAVLDTVGDYATDKIQGQATLPGAAGGTATVSFQIARRGLGRPTGSFTVQDPGAGVQISARVSDGVRAPVDGTVTWQGTATVRRDGRDSAQTAGFTVEDRRPDPGDHAVRIRHAGQDRRAILRLPQDYDGSPRPVLFHFPGLFESPWIAEYFGRMADHARDNGYIMITPEHYGQGWQGVPAGTPSPDVDDPGFVVKLQDVLVQRFNADPRRLYASGMSNGGFFTSKMACDNRRFAAFAPVSGQLSDIDACSPGRDVPIVMLHGDGDFIVPYGNVPSVAAFWARNNGCGTASAPTNLPDTAPRDNTTVVRHDFPGCPADAPVVLYQIKGGGHNWPGGAPFLGPFLGGTTYDISANTVIWDFVSRFRLP